MHSAQQYRIKNTEGPRDGMNCETGPCTLDSIMSICTTRVLHAFHWAAHHGVGVRRQLFLFLLCSLPSGSVFTCRKHFIPAMRECKCTAFWGSRIFVYMSVLVCNTCKVMHAFRNLLHIHACACVDYACSCINFALCMHGPRFAALTLNSQLKKLKKLLCPTEPTLSEEEEWAAPSAAP